MTDENECDESLVIEVEAEASEESWGDKMLTPDRPLSPRHRKLAEMAAQGMRNQAIAKALGYTDSRVSILLSNSRIKDLVGQIQERIYQETIGDRLKKMAEPALNEIERCLNDRTNRYKEQLKVDTAKWLVEKLDGKAVQKHDIGENMLSIVMDKLDAMKQSGKSLSDAERDVIELTPQAQIEGRIKENPAKTEDDYLKNWIADFTSLPKE